MPNFDTGHLFLTTLAPIKKGTTRDDRGVKVSHEQKIRTTLAILPTALQSPATEEIGINSPFARNLRTHLCRFMVLDNVVFNGRVKQDAIVTALSGEDPIQPRPVDQLTNSFLLFVADIDAVTEDGAPLPAKLSKAQQNEVRDAYARRLWETMEAEICEIYENCEGFDTVKDADGFADYLRRCQVETTMPFNDYWLNPPNLHQLPVKGMAAMVLVPLLVALLGAIGWFTGSVPLLTWIFGWTPGWTFAGGLIATALAVCGAYAYTLRNGEKPMPQGEYGDLPSVLKSLYLQQKFADFAVRMQGKSDAEIHAAFGDFIAETQPENKMAPTQVPGVISIQRKNAIFEQ
ncbi:MAG: hypothetical protein ACPW60_14130 [Methylohalobius sp. ZOD2]|nr:hypothetical protein [Methylothermaceae bacterium]